MSPRFSSPSLDNKPRGAVSGFILSSVDWGGPWLCGISGDSGQDAQSRLARLWVGHSWTSGCLPGAVACLLALLAIPVLSHLRHAFISCFESHRAILQFSAQWWWYHRTEICPTCWVDSLSHRLSEHCHNQWQLAEAHASATLDLVATHLCSQKDDITTSAPWPWSPAAETGLPLSCGCPSPSLRVWVTSKGFRDWLLLSLQHVTPNLEDMSLEWRFIFNYFSPMIRVESLLKLV